MERGDRDKGDREKGKDRSQVPRDDKYFLHDDRDGDEAPAVRKGRSIADRLGPRNTEPADGRWKAGPGLREDDQPERYGGSSRGQKQEQQGRGRDNGAYPKRGRDSNTGHMGEEDYGRGNGAARSGAGDDRVQRGGYGGASRRGAAHLGHDDRVEPERPTRGEMGRSYGAEDETDRGDRGGGRGHNDADRGFGGGAGNRGYGGRGRGGGDGSGRDRRDEGVEAGYGGRGGRGGERGGAVRMDPDGPPPRANRNYSEHDDRLGPSHAEDEPQRERPYTERPRGAGGFEGRVRGGGGGFGSGRPSRGDDMRERGPEEGRGLSGRLASRLGGRVQEGGAGGVQRFQPYARREDDDRINFIRHKESHSQHDDRDGYDGMQRVGRDFTKQARDDDAAFGDFGSSRDSFRGRGRGRGRAGGRGSRFLDRMADDEYEEGALGNGSYGHGREQSGWGGSVGRGGRFEGRMDDRFGGRGGRGQAGERFGRDRSRSRSPAGRWGHDKFIEEVAAEEGEAPGGSQAAEEGMLTGEQAANGTDTGVQGAGDENGEGVGGGEDGNGGVLEDADVAADDEMYAALGLEEYAEGLKGEEAMEG